MGRIIKKSPVRRNSTTTSELTVELWEQQHSLSNMKSRDHQSHSGFLCKSPKFSLSCRNKITLTDESAEAMQPVQLM